MKVYCDTDTLIQNIRQNDAKSKRELDALKELLSMRSTPGFVMLRSLVNLRELMETENTEQREVLLGDYKDLESITKDEKVLAFQIQIDQFGGSVSNPLVSDVQDEGLRDELLRHGIERRDAEHIAQAISNCCDVFLTRDEGILKKRDAVQVLLSKIRIRRPSELLEELTGANPSY